MPRYMGKNGKVKLGTGFVTPVVSFDIEETVATVDATAMEDAWEAPLAGVKSWSGTITLRHDPANTAQAARAGDSLLFEGYPDGNAVGKEFLSGTVIVESRALSAPHDNVVDLTLRVKGVGALSIGTVI